MRHKIILEMISCSVNPFSPVGEEGKFSLHFLVKNNFYFYILWKKKLIFRKNATKMLE